MSQDSVDTQAGDCSPPDWSR